MSDEAVRVGLLTGADLRRGAPGGTRSYVYGLLRFLARRGIPAGVVSNGPAEALPAGTSILPVTPEHVPSAIAFQRALRAWSGESVLRRLGLLHFQRPDDLAALRRAHLPPAVCTLHGDSARGIGHRRGRLARLAYLRRESWAIPRFRALVAVDEATGETYRRRYPEVAERIHTIPVAVDEGFDAAPLGTARDGPVTFLYVGRLSVEKRVDRIIEAVRALDLPRARLRIVGSGPEAARLRRASDGHTVEFLGHRPHEDLPRLYREADALVLASAYEGLPTAALEAIACGCPVVALSGRGLDHLLVDGRGFLSPDLDGLPAALRAAVGRRRSGPPITLPSEYTWDHVGESLLRIYQSVAPEAFP